VVLRKVSLHDFVCAIGIANENGAIALHEIVKLRVDNVIQFGNRARSSDENIHMGLLRSEAQKINRCCLIVPSSLHCTYVTDHLHFITCSFVAAFQRVDNEEARRKIEVYASQSGEVRTRQFARAMALEQLPFLFPGRSRPGAGQ
jgi:hypothetical protein